MTIKAYIAGLTALAVFGCGWYVKDAIEERNQLRAEVTAKESELQQFKDAYAVTSRVLTQRLKTATAIKENTASVQVEIEKRRPGAECELPVDWRVLHDAAASGRPP